jgi:hypothetical protein
LVSYLDECKDEQPGALARLTVELRTSAGAPSDSLKLASWYTREAQAIDADRVLSDLELGQAFNDLTIRFWETPDDLRSALEQEFVTRFGLTSSSDVVGFNQKALGLTAEGWVPFEDHDGLTNFRSCPQCDCIPMAFTISIAGFRRSSAASNWNHLGSPGDSVSAMKKLLGGQSYLGSERKT